MSGIGSAYAQSPADQPSPSATSTPAAAPAPETAAAPATPSFEVLKQARQEGFRIRRQPQTGLVVFCKKTTPVGTRFATESCIDETQIQEYLIRAKDQREKMENLKGSPTNIEVPPPPMVHPHN